MKDRMMRLASLAAGLFAMLLAAAAPAAAQQYPPSLPPSTPPQVVEVGRDSGAEAAGLAFTGTDLALIVGAVAVLLAVGITLVMLGRRRAARAA